MFSDSGREAIDLALLVGGLSNPVIARYAHRPRAVISDLQFFDFTVLFLAKVLPANLGWSKAFLVTIASMSCAIRVCIVRIDDLCGLMKQAIGR